MGGKKRKIDSTKKIEVKSAKAVAFSKRRKGLYSKTSQLCLLSRAQVAILNTPISSVSNASFYSFGHSSVDNVVSAFLSNQRPKDDLGLGFWWEEESLHKSEDSNELSNAVDTISRMLQDLKGLQSAAVENRKDIKKKNKKKIVSHETQQELDQNQALILHSSSSSNSEGLLKNNEAEIQIVAISENNNNIVENSDVLGQELDQNQTLALQSCSASNCANDVPLASSEGLVMNNAVENQIVAISDNNNNNNNDDVLEDLVEFSEHLDQLLEFDTVCDIGLTMSSKMDNVSTNQNPCSASSEPVQESAPVTHMSCNQEVNLNLSDFNENQIVAISNNNNNNNIALSRDNEELDIDQLFDFATDFEDLFMDVDDISMSQNQTFASASASEAVEEREQ
ncbi:unnamed protein product [Cochlearia groenlandica]